MDGSIRDDIIKCNTVRFSHNAVERIVKRQLRVCCHPPLNGRGNVELWRALHVPMTSAEHSVGGRVVVADRLMPWRLYLVEMFFGNNQSPWPSFFDTSLLRV